MTNGPVNQILVVRPGSTQKATRHLRLTVGTQCCMVLPEQDTQREAQKEYDGDYPGDHHLDQAPHQCPPDLVERA